MLRKMVIFFIMLSFSAFSYGGDIPRVILHQGYLTDTNGNPINGNVNISFAIYETLSGGTPLLEEDIGSVTIKDGFYALEIGKNSNLYSIFSDKNSLFLEIRINNEALSPRQRIGAVPFAFVAYDVVGDIHPSSISIGGKKIFDETGKWVGDSSSIPGVKSITAVSPLTGGTITDSGSIGIPKADQNTNGYLSKDDYLIFINKQNRIKGFCNPGTCIKKINEDGSVECEICGGSGGSVSISAGTGIIVDPSPIIGVGTISIDKTYFDSLYVQQGQPSSITEPMIATAAVSKEKLNSSGCTNGQILKFSSSTNRWECASDETGSAVNITGGNGIIVTPNPITSSGVISLSSDFVDGAAYDSRFVNEGQPNSITSAMIVNGAITGSHIASSSISIDKLSRSGCTNGQTIKYNDIAGNWICATDNNTTYSAGTGLSLTGNVFSVKNNSFQCPALNQSIKTINIDTGAVTCEDDDNSGGTVTTVNTGTGLTGGPITTSGTISLASNYVDGSVYDSRFVNENQANSITSAMITDGTITNSDIANSTITLSKLAKSGCADGQVIKYYVEQPGVEYFVCAVDNTGITSCNTCDATFVNENQANSITSAMIADGTILFADLGTNSCNANQIIKRNAANTAWICSDDANSGGTVTTVNTGTGLTGGPITTSGTISLASNYVDGSVYDSRFVNESQANSITSAMITDGTIVNSDLSAGTYSNITGVGTLGSLTVSGNTYLATTSGNVGIGTNSPSTKLHLYTTSSSGGSIALRMQYAFTGPINGDRSSDWTLYATTGSGSFGISNSAGTHFYIEGNNNYIGIGTTGPTQKLDVSGNIRASGQLISAVPTGTAPLSVSSTTQVNNLNADMVDGWHAAVVLTGMVETLYGTNSTTWIELYKWAVDFDSVPGNTLRGLGFVQSSAGSIAGRIRFLVNGTQVGSDCTFTATTTNTALNCPVITYTKPSGVGNIRIEIRRDTSGSEYIYYGQNTLTLK